MEQGFGQTGFADNGIELCGSDMKLELSSQRTRFERILLVIFVLTLPLANPWVRGDGVGYYAYARAPLIEHNFDFTHDYQSANDSFREARCDENGQPRPEYLTETGHLDNHFSVGPAMLWFPFLVLAHGGVLLARAFGFAVAADGFSAPYRFAMAFATCLYGFLGLWLSYRLASKYVERRWSFIATLAIWWASSLPIYMYFNPSWSHAHSAFIVAVFLTYWDATREGRSLKEWLVLGVIGGLMLDVYYANLMIVSVLIVEALRQYRAILRSSQYPSPDFWRLAIRHAMFGVAVCLIMIPTFVSRWIVYGGLFNSGYVSIRDYLWSSPVFFSVLFSSNHGLLSWTPVIAFALIGLLLFAIRFPQIGIPFLAAVGAFYLFISFYPDWAGIASFGNRFFVSLTTFWILGLAYLLQQVAARFKRTNPAMVVTSGALACLVLWNLGLMFQWGVHLVPARGPISFRQAAYNQVYVVPFEAASRIRAYVLRRRELMKQIEQKDADQRKSQSQP